MIFTSVAVAVKTVLTFKVNIPNRTANAPDERLNVPLTPLTSVPPLVAASESFGSGATLPLRMELPGNNVADVALIVRVEFPLVTSAPVVLSMEMLLNEIEGDVTSKTFATLISETVKDALLIAVVPSLVCVPAVIVMFKLPVAVNKVLLPVPTVKIKSLAPVYAPLPKTMLVTVPDVSV